MRAIGWLLVVAACGGKQPPPQSSPIYAPKLQAPIPIDVHARGAAYLTSVAMQLQPGWEQFLDDCRFRLPVSHPLNTMTLAATAMLVIDHAGKLQTIELVSSGDPDFDRAVRDVIADARPLPVPPAELLSDDELVHLRWLFARDRRQAGPATAEVVAVELPLAVVTERLLGRGELVRAIRRIASAPATDPDRAAMTERVMIAALREALASLSGAVRRASVEAIGRAELRALAPEIRVFLAPTVDTELRLVAIAAAAALADRDAAPQLLAELRTDLDDHPRLAVAEVAALVALGEAPEAAAVLHEASETATGAKLQITLRALAIAPDPTLAPNLAGWMAHGDARARTGVCAALPGSAARSASSLIERGLRDADATVRATCADAAARLGKRAGGGVVTRLRELVHDRDRAARARGVAALAALAPGSLHVVDDPAPQVRAAYTAAASEAELLALANDRDADVRAAALLALGSRAGVLATTAATDAAAQVRRAAVQAIDDEEALSRLSRDDSPEVATSALIRLAGRRGRTAITTAFLDQLAKAPSGSAERVRIALAWLLAP